MFHLVVFCTFSSPSKQPGANMFDYSFFLMQAQTVSKMIETQDAYGPVGESRERTRELVDAGVSEGWDILSYRNWYAGYVRCARQLKVISPAQEDELYEIVQCAAENAWLVRETYIAKLNSNLA